jgi:hypothetical protein
MLLQHDDTAGPPRVRHYVGLPAAIAAGSPQRDLPAARVLIIRELDRQIFLYRYDEAGAFGGDTWHQTVEDAKHQADFEYGPLQTAWRETPPELQDPQQIVRWMLGQSAG